ncbi:hypothetical protein [Arcanobacterium bovis]|uniref:Isopeptide-forming domain-containing fimbrial protein n=1 Tax=Arcanobacterium bovis TaxID=2529275 RepID=A0A4Q9V0M1_9ACTO|nr:hypothetical protein [Arcanobacterium bovis]TBW22136.1 hypothetical protein EZJ44_04735 [Arcanobacterium bovis]
MKPKKSRIIGTLAALCSATLLTSPLAFAGNGAGTAGGGAISRYGADQSFVWYAEDQFFPNVAPTQGWGQTSIDYFATKVLANSGKSSFGTSAPGYYQEACTNAINEAIARGANDPIPATKARVVYLGMYDYTLASAPTLFGGGYARANDDGITQYNLSWNTIMGSWNSYFMGNSDTLDTTNELRALGQSKIDAMGSGTLSAVCIARNDKEPGGAPLPDPNPNKAWVLDSNGALVTSDPNKTNAVGADQKLFLHGDKVGSVVTGSIPNGITAPLTDYQIADDWSGAAKYVDFTNTGVARVYRDGVDVTSQFTITLNGTTTIATAKPEFLATTAGLSQPAVMKLYIAGAFKPVTPETDTNGQTVQLTNKGWEKYNDKTVPTNEPPVYVWNPDPHKDIVGSTKQDGNQTSINSTMVFPGQWVQYVITLDTNLPAQTAKAYPITTFGVEDVYSPLIYDVLVVLFFSLLVKLCKWLKKTVKLLVKLCKWLKKTDIKLASELLDTFDQ